MKKRISLFLAVIMVLTVMVSAIPVVAATNTFNASDANPTISTAEDYLAFFKAVYVDNNSFNGKTVTLLNDITVNDTAASDWYAKDGVVKMANSDDDGWSWFEGTFDGNGKTIRGVVIDKKFRNDLVIGLFPHARNATIKNLTVDGFYVSSNGAKATGGLIGRVGNGVTVDGVTLKNGTVNATNCNQENNQRGVGALIGYVYLDTESDQKVNITNCTVDPSVRVTCDGTNWVGGIIGAIQLQNKNHAHISFKGSSFSTYDESLLAVGYYNQNSNSGLQLVLKIVDEGGNKWSGGGSGDKTDWVNETIGTFGIYSVVEEVIPSGNTFNASDANPTISTAEDYIAFFKAAYGSDSKLDFAGKTITMLNDITLNDTTVADWYTKSDAVKLAGNDSWKHFKGTFDGGNHTLKGVIVESVYRSDAPIGIFPYVTFGGAVVNLTVDGFYVNSPNTSSDPAYGNAGIGGLIGHAKANVTVDNVTMKNGIVTCVANGKGGLGAVVGAYDGQDKNQQLKITNTTVENTVKVIGGNDNVYVGGIIGYVHENFKSHSTVIDFSGSVFQPYGANDSLAPIGSFKAGGAVGDVAFSWTFKNINNSYSKLFELSAGTDYTADWNEAIIAAGCYGATAAVTVDFVGIQTRSSDNGARFVGLIKAVDLEQISSLGFEITVDEKTAGPDVIKCTKVYASILEDGTPVDAPEGYYYFTFVLTGVAENTTFSVKACATINEVDYISTVGSCTYPSANS